MSNAESNHTLSQSTQTMNRHQTNQYQFMKPIKNFPARNQLEHSMMYRNSECHPRRYALVEVNCQVQYFWKSNRIINSFIRQIISYSWHIVCRLKNAVRTGSIHRTQANAGSRYSVKTTSKSVHLFGWNIVHWQTHIHGHTNCSENISSQRFCN